VDRQVVELTRSRDQYVDALLAIAGAKPRLDLAPAPLFLRKRHLKQRVVSIMKEVRMSRMRSVSSLVAGLGIMALACWFVTATFPLAAAPQMVADGPGVTVDTGGTVMHRSGILYPDAARRSRVQGVVTVEATVDSSGNVVDTRVLSGPIELRRAAQQSVLTWHFATDTSMNTRQVKINFELSALPEESPLPPVPPAVPQMDLAGRPASGQPASAPSAAGRKGIGPPWLEGKRLSHIITAGMTDSARSDLLSRIPVHEGDILNADLLERVRRIVREFDEHMNVATGVNANGEVTLILSVPGAPSAGVIGGIVGGVPGGCARGNWVARALRGPRQGSHRTRLVECFHHFTSSVFGAAYGQYRYRAEQH
jgi:TonB family protein